MAIVSSATVKTYCAISDADYTSYGSYIHDAVEAFVKKYAGQPFESTTYTNKLYDGSGGYKLWLEECPIISVKYVAIDPYDAIKIKNTLTDASLVTVVIDATNVTLTVEGGAGANTSALAKGTYTTLTLLVAAVNALSAYGWSCELYDTDFGSLKTSYLYDQQIDLTPYNAVAETYDYLLIADGFAENLVIDKARGQLYSPSGFPYGFQNIVATYTAGYATIPADITFFILDTIKMLWSRKSNDAENVDSWKVGDISVSYAKVYSEVNQQMLPVLDKHKRIVI